MCFSCHDPAPSPPMSARPGPNVSVPFLPQCHLCHMPGLPFSLCHLVWSPFKVDPLILIHIFASVTVKLKIQDGTQKLNTVLT